MSDTKQADALRLANILRGIDARNRFANKMLSAAAETIESLHAENESLKAQLEAVGAGGVGPLVGAPAQPVAQAHPADDGVVWCGWACQMPGNLPRLFGAREIAELNLYEDEGDRLIFMSAKHGAPQPAAQVQPYDQREMGLCDKCGWKGVIPYADGPVCVVCEHNKTLAPGAAAQAKEDACEWLLTDADNGVWESACGEAWTFIDGGPVDNSVRFCHGCGKPVAIAAQQGGAA